MSAPNIKFEDSPQDSLADSFVSTPGASYTSLFDTMPHQTDAMTPRSFDDESMFGDSVTGTPAPEAKQPVKKRKSWGQQLPEPKTNLPPRKRAKTEDEKEQRRVERVLRNRRAAQSSRERKRQEVEALENEKLAIEQRNQDLERRLADMEARNIILQQQIDSISTMNGFPVSSDLRQQSPVTLSQELFSSRDSEGGRSITVNPASLSPSPKIRPIDDSNASSSDMTQHPAVSVGRTALESFNGHISALEHHHDDQPHEFSSYFNGPEPTSSDNYILEQGILPLTNDFDLNNDYMGINNDSVFDDFIINDYLHTGDEIQITASEIQS